MSHKSWKKLSSETLFTHPRIILVEDDVELPDGTQTKYLRHENLPDYVTVLAVRDGKIAFLREYSYPNDEWLWQFPEGGIERGESAEVAAVRELREEAGLMAAAFEPLGKNYGHHRRTTEINYVFLASGVSETKKSGGDLEEQGTELHWFDEAEVLRMMASGEIVQKNALAALALYLAHSSGGQGV